MYVRDGFIEGRPASPLPASPDAASFHDALTAHKARWVLWQDAVDLGLSLDATSVVRGQLALDARHLSDAAYFTLVHEEPSEHARVYQIR